MISLELLIIYNFLCLLFPMTAGILLLLWFSDVKNYYIFFALRIFAKSKKNTMTKEMFLFIRIHHVSLVLWQHFHELKWCKCFSKKYFNWNLLSKNHEKPSIITLTAILKMNISEHELFGWVKCSGSFVMCEQCLYDLNVIFIHLTDIIVTNLLME